VIHGLVVWSLVTLLSVSVLGTSAAALMGGLMTGLTRFMPVAVEAASSTTGGVTRHNPGAADSALTPGGTVGGENGIGRTEADLRTRQGAAADGTFVGGPNGIGRDTPGRNADEPQTREAARDLGKAAIFSFFGLLLGAVAASLGGSIGRHMFQRYDATGAVPVPANAAATG
jgi:hypothetical protein